jgi:hypothetical protein
MNRMWILSAMLLCASACAIVSPSRPVSTDIDGTQPLVCTVISVSECFPGAGCEAVSPEQVDLPRHLWVDVAGKSIQDRKSGEGRTSPVESVTRVDGKLILQGAEQGRENVRDGFGWTLAIMENGGEMVMTASGDMTAIVAFGACTPY